ncbi:polysaccharide biosynthesis/export family protein [Ferrimonas balearica]|nr:polysaccharide biosynthesis/export family protein [Ferrimonas balearica]
MKHLLTLPLMAFLASCGVIYNSPDVRKIAGDGAAVTVEPITVETVSRANADAYMPRALPPAFRQTARSPGLKGAGPVPDPVFSEHERPFEMALRVPPDAAPAPYRIGVGDVVLLATPQASGSIEQLTGLLAAQSARQGYTVQDDGTIAIPTVGRVAIAGQTLEEAEATLFQRLVENQVDPSFSLEISEFNSQHISIGGAVGSPKVVPITLVPLYLDAALALVGGITVADQDFASVRIYRDGELYQIPLNALYSDEGLRRIRLQDGDSVFVDTAYDLELAQAYFAEQIQLTEFRRSSRSAALGELQAEIALQRGQLAERRTLFEQQAALGAVERDYIYMVGEMANPGRQALPFEQMATLADMLFGESGGVPIRTGSYGEIYVLRGTASGAVTAWQLDSRNAANLILATRFEMRPNDIVFVPEQPVTRWNRTISQIVPSLIFQTAGAIQ